MPYSKRKLKDGKFQVVKTSNGMPIGKPKTEAEANKLLAALYANVKK